MKKSKVKMYKLLSESRERERRNAGDEIVEKFSSSFHNFSNFG